MPSLLSLLQALEQPKVEQPAPPPPPPEPRYWAPVALELHPQRVQCACGAEFHAAPLLFVRECCGTRTRLRRVYKPGQFAGVPRLQVEPDLTHVDACEACFVPALSSPQLALFDEPVEEFHTPPGQPTPHAALVAQIERLRESWQAAEAQRGGFFL